MVRGDERRSAAPQSRIQQVQRRLVIAVVERKKGQHSGKGSRKVRGMARAEGLEFAVHESRGEAARPFIEIAQHQARSAQIGLQ